MLYAIHSLHVQTASSQDCLQSETCYSWGRHKHGIREINRSLKALTLGKDVPICVKLSTMSQQCLRI